MGARSAALGVRILGQPLRSRTLSDGAASPCSADLGCWRKWRVHAASRNQARRIRHRESAPLRELGVTETTTSPRGRGSRARQLFIQVKVKGTKTSKFQIRGFTRYEARRIAALRHPPLMRLSGKAPNDRREKQS